MAKIQLKWSGFHSSYNESNVNTYALEKAGIYLLWVKLKDDKWRCFYVGQADNLKTRLLQHLSDTEKNECIKTHVNKHVCGFEYALVGKQADRDGIEKYLYEYYNPECNKISPPDVEPIEVNLP
jgi:Nuclease subunit of the excinuclease complex